ncbi:MAG: RNA-binding protein [Phycisphaeraceae bacterium]|nr:RNA-binding protein [Phycisphaeraceae bacterium]
MKLYVGNLSYDTTEDTLRSEFGAHGQVQDLVIISDRETGRPKGFGFVTMGSEDEAKAAMSALDGTELDGRTIKVNEAKPRENRGGGGGGGGRRW